MSALNKILIILLFSGMGLGAYAGSSFGWGLPGVRNQQTMAQIKQNCPNYYQTRDGRCMATTFRSYFLMRSVRGGGFGSGK